MPGRLAVQRRRRWASNAAAAIRTRTHRDGPQPRVDRRSPPPTPSAYTLPQQRLAEVRAGRSRGSRPRSPSCPRCRPRSPDLLDRRTSARARVTPASSSTVMISSLRPACQSWLPSTASTGTSTSRGWQRPGSRASSGVAVRRSGRRRAGPGPRLPSSVRECGARTSSRRDSRQWMSPAAATRSVRASAELVVIATRATVPTRRPRRWKSGRRGYSDLHVARARPSFDDIEQIAQAVSRLR